MTLQTQIPIKPLAVSPANAAHMAGIGRTFLYGALTSGELPSFKHGRRRLIMVTELEKWLKEIANAPATPAIKARGDADWKANEAARRMEASQ